MFPRLLLLLPAFLLFALQTRAQAYEPGLLVRSNGDTLRGEIENSFWVEPPLFIRFRPTPEQPSQLFQPRQLRAVSFTGGRYFRYEVLTIDHAAQTELGRLGRGNSFDIHTDSLLAEVLVDGPATLLRVALSGTVHYLVHTPGHTYLDLCERRYLRQTTTGAWSITDGNNYRNQLDVYLLDCPAARTAATTGAFSANMLVATVQAFNQACGPTHQPGRSWLAQASLRRRVAFQAGVLVGGRLNHISSPSYYLGDACTDCQVHPFGGLYAELFQPNRIAAVYGELSLSSFRNQGAEHVGGTSGSPIYMYYSYQGLLSTARLGVRFFFPLRHEQQLLFGLSYEWNTVWHPTQTVTAGPAYLVRDEDLPFATPTLLPNLALGWRIRRLTLSLDGQVYRSKSDDDGISSLFLGKDFGVRFGTAYRLGRNPDAKRR